MDIYKRQKQGKKEKKEEEDPDAKLICFMRTPAVTAMPGEKQILAKTPSRQTLCADISTAKSSAQVT